MDVAAERTGTYLPRVLESTFPAYDGKKKPRHF